MNVWVLRHGSTFVGVNHLKVWGGGGLNRTGVKLESNFQKNIFFIQIFSVIVPGKICFNQVFALQLNSLLQLF